jgi:uncharacterized protein YbaP (TraB family)
MKRLRHWVLAAAALLATALQAAPAVPAAPAAPAAPTADCPPPPAPLSADAVAAGMREAVDRGFLFRLTKNGRSSWLYGTIHVARQAWMFPGPRLREALLAADQVALELDLTDPEIVRRLMGVITASPGTPPLPPALAERLAQQAAALCAGPELAALKPEMQAVTLSVLAARRSGLEPAYGIDGFLAGFARQVKKPVLSLESPESQIGLLLQPTPEATAQFVGRALDELASQQAATTLVRIAAAWDRSDWGEMGRYAEWCGCMDTEQERQLMRRLLDERNVAIAVRIGALHAAGTRLFAGVGALHLVGPQGLPALLAAQGFQVEQIVPPSP